MKISVLFGLITILLLISAYLFIKNKNIINLPQVPASPTAVISTTPPQIENNLKTACTEKNGIWLDEFNECESQDADAGLDQEECENLGGKFDGCASACRHSEDKDIVCIGVCVNVCSFQ